MRELALSLRRAFVHAWCKGGHRRTIGFNDDKDAHAALFEVAVESHLRDQGVNFITEEEIKAPYRHTHTPFPLSPDFLLLDNVAINGHRVNWIEAKAFYAAASMIDGPPGAISNLPVKAQRYVAAFGPGAFVFLRGFSRDLIPRFERCSTLLLDATPISPRLTALLSDGHVAAFPKGWDHAPTPVAAEVEDVAIVKTEHAERNAHDNISNCGLTVEDAADDMTSISNAAASSGSGRHHGADADGVKMAAPRRLVASVSLERQVS